MNRSISLASSLVATLCAGMLTASLAHAGDPPAVWIERGPRLPVRPAPQNQDDDGGIAGGTLNGPDVIVSTVGTPVTLWGTNTGTDGLLYAAYSFQTVSCNLGEADAIWIDDTNLNNPLRNQHPVIGNTLFRLKSGRFEQIGLGWLKHGFCAADAPSCGIPYEGNFDCDWLATHATDTYNSGRNGEQPGLGPRSEIDPWTGVYPYPYGLNWQLTSADPLFKRMRVLTDDVNPTPNAGALYFGEVQYICTDEQPVNRYNNVSYRRMLVGAANGATWNLSFTGSTTPQLPAISAWRANDPTVTLTNIDVPGDGRMILGTKVTSLGGGQWSYEYALYNMNSARAAQSFAVPFETSAGLANIGFHDISYHSGEPYSSVDWATSVGTSGSMSWATENSITNPNANALRWGTLYNFRFTAGAPPRCRTATIGLFKTGSPASITVNAVGPATCVADIVPVGAGDGQVDVNDLLGVINRWGPCGADTSPCGCSPDMAPDGGDDLVDVNDLLKVINNWGGCP